MDLGGDLQTSSPERVSSNILTQDFICPQTLSRFHHHYSLVSVALKASLTM